MVDIKDLYDQAKNKSKSNSGVIDECRTHTKHILVELGKEGIKEIEFATMRRMVETLMQEKRGESYELHYSSFRYAMRSEKTKKDGISYTESTKVIKLVGGRK